MLRFRLLSVLLGLSLLASPAYAINVGDRAPYFEAPSLSPGVRPVRLSNYKGKVVYLEFWASWCSPCWDAFPHLEEIYTQMAGDGFEIIGINVNDEKPEALKAAKKLAPNFVLVRPLDDLLMNLYDVHELPYGVLVDRKGIVRATFSGLSRSDREELKKMIKHLTWKGL